MPRRRWWTYHAKCIDSHSVHHPNNGSNQGSISRTRARLCAIVTRRARRLEKNKSLSNQIYLDWDIVQPAFLLLALLILFCLFLSLCFYFCCFSGFVLSLHKDFHPLVLLFSTSIEACIFRNDATKGDAPFSFQEWRGSIASWSNGHHSSLYVTKIIQKEVICHSSFIDTRTDAHTHTQFVIIYTIVELTFEFFEV